MFIQMGRQTDWFMYAMNRIMVIKTCGALSTALVTHKNMFYFLLQTYNQNLTFIKRINFESLRSLTQRDREEEYSINKTRLNCLSKSISEYSITQKINWIRYGHILISIDQSINQSIACIFGQSLVRSHWSSSIIPYVWNCTNNVAFVSLKTHDDR